MSAHATTQWRQPCSVVDTNDAVFKKNVAMILKGGPFSQKSRIFTVNFKDLFQKGGRPGMRTTPLMFQVEVLLKFKQNLPSY
jgi:hypothetical protein